MERGEFNLAEDLAIAFYSIKKKKKKRHLEKLFIIGLPGLFGFAMFDRIIGVNCHCSKQGVMHTILINSSIFLGILQCQCHLISPSFHASACTKQKE